MPSLKGKVANRRFDGRVCLLPYGEGGTAIAVADEGKRFLYKVLIKRIKFNFSQMGKWDLQELFYRKSSLHLQKLFKTAHSMCLRKQAL